ncbi:FCS-Like Zinc finger 2-like [Rhododendron vialii]|uniref:FCS-Like Zinc finger 2-like n=1 Tax=Rhododendron vialii TaxID=182163 RepID=UPI002660565A|nr:FCS-Like Zinc finger 2-like [Rhododendron vialii]
MDSTVARRFCFIEEDDGHASLAEASFSGNQHHHPFFLSRPLYYNTLSSQSKNSLRNLSFSSSSSPRSGRFQDSGKFYFEEVVVHQPYFLEACSLCKKPLADNKDIFMYRGDTPFCSEECREEEIEIDEAREKKWNLSATMKALRKDKKKKSKSTSPNKAQGYPYRSGTVAAA